MEPIQIFKKTEDGKTWEYTVLLGHDSQDVGFLVKIHRQHWEQLTDGREPPEQLLKRSFQFLLKKYKGQKYAIWRDFDLREVQRHFPEYEEEIQKSNRRIIGNPFFSIR